MEAVIRQLIRVAVVRLLRQMKERAAELIEKKTSICTCGVTEDTGTAVSTAWYQLKDSDDVKRYEDGEPMWFKAEMVISEDNSMVSRAVEYGPLKGFKIQEELCELVENKERYIVRSYTPRRRRRGAEDGDGDGVQLLGLAGRRDCPWRWRWVPCS